MKLSLIKMRFSYNELMTIIYSLRLVEYYEIIQFVFDYIKLNVYNVSEVLYMFLHHLITPRNKQQQNNQFEIISKLFKFQRVRDELSITFDDVIYL